MYRIYSMAMDGSEKKVLKEFSAADDISLSGGVHRGCAYYKIYHYLTNDLEIYRLDITEPDGEQELIYEGTGDAILKRNWNCHEYAGVGCRWYISLSV